MEIKMKMIKEDWEKILKDANMLAKESSINLLVYENTAELARTHIRKFPDDKQKKISDEVHPAVAEAMGRS